MEESLNTKKTKNLKKIPKKLVNTALALTLSATPMALSAQNETTQENEWARINLSVDSTPRIPWWTIDFYKAQEGVVEWQEEISEEEVVEYIQNHLDEISPYIKAATYASTEEKVIEELLNDNGIEQIILKMINRKDIQQAALDWDSKYIQEKLHMELLNYESTFYPLITTYVGLLAVLIILCFRNLNKKKKEKKSNEQTNKETNR